MSGERPPVLFLPGGVTPVAPSYAPLLAELGDSISPVLKELEVYSGDVPPADYSIAMEADAVARTADSVGLSSFHIVGFSGGGAIALAFAARYPERLRSLAMFEPANVPGAWDPDERADWEAFSDGMDDLPPEVFIEQFTRRQLRPGAVPPPPPDPPPAWMARRPAGLRAMIRAFSEDETDRGAWSKVTCPVYLAYGLLTAEYMVRRVRRLAGLFPDIWIQAYPGIHHFVPPQRSRPAEYAGALRRLWARAEEREPTTPGRGDGDYAA